MWVSLRRALIVTRREVRDQFRDWRIVFPVVVLTLIFPILMNFTARQAVRFVERYNAPLIGDRLVPFLLMVVGFFPISVSLVMALESFVGEKERRSIEPLLCSPLSDNQLYVGKLLAAMIPPLLASYMGISVYLVGVIIQIDWQPPPILITQIVLLTTVQAILMVSGAIVISSQTTSTRAANLLASFIIIPMAFLIQWESIVMFWGQYSVLWWAILGLIVITVLLIRVGLAYFNREELLGRELDSLNLRWGWRQFKLSFKGEARSIITWYQVEIMGALRTMGLPILVTILTIPIGIWAGIQMAGQFRLPAERLAFDQLNQGFVQGLDAIRFFTPIGAGTIWFHNLRVVALATFLGVFSFGVLGLLVLMLPLIFIAYITANVAAAGFSPALFLGALVLPHGILEIPAIILAGAAVVNLGASLTAPAGGKTLGEAWVVALAKWFKIIVGLVIPLFLAAALVEVFITPYVAVWALSR
jgi:uncharacterized membrane protein SpoIIM required for sporulation